MKRSAFPVLLTVMACALSGAASASTELEVSGRVLGAQGTPLPEARIILSRVESPYEESMRLGLSMESAEALQAPALVTVKSDARGRFVLEAPEAGFYRLRIESPAYAPAELRLAPLLEARALQDAQLERESRVVVRVVDAEGAPLAGALVRGVEAGPGFGWRPAEQVRLTNGEGEAILQRPRRTRLAVSACAPGYTARLEKESGASRIEFSLASAGSRTIRAVDERDRPVAGALFVLSSGGVTLGMTDERGEYVLPLPGDGSLSLIAIAPDGRRARVEAALSDDPEAPPLLARFLPTVTARGRVLSAEDRRPIPAALVWASGEGTRFATTDGSGVYTLPGIVDTRARINAASPGHLRARKSLVLDGFEGVASFSLAPASAIEGVVVDRAGRPVPHASVEAGVSRGPRGARDSRRGMSAARFVGRRAGAFSRSGSASSARADEEGRFRLAYLDPGSDYEVRAGAPSYATSETLVTDLEPGRTRRDVRVVMLPGQTLRGRVVDEEGVPLAGARIEAFGAASWGGRGARMNRHELAGRLAASDLEGRFALERLPEGAIDVVITRAGYARELKPGVEMQEGEDRDLGDIALDPGRSVFGRVLDDAGEPVADASVYVLERAVRNMMALNRPPLRMDPEAFTGADGSFIVSDRAADETISILAHRSGFTLNHRSGVEVASADVVIIELEAASRVSGVVLDEDGEAVAGASVTLTQATVGPGGRTFYTGTGGWAESDSEGRFVIEDVRPDTWILGAGARGFRSVILPGIEVPRGEDVEGLELSLSRGARLEGVVLAPDGSPAVDARISIANRDDGGIASQMGFGEVSAVSDAEGRFALDGLEPGDQSISVWHGDYPSLKRDVEIGEGTTSVSLTLEAGMSIAGRVVDGSGTPVAGARALLRRPSGGWLAHSAECEPDGSFFIEGVEPGEYEAYARATGYSAPDESVRVTLVEGRATAPIELLLEESGVIRGRVLGLESRDYADVRVTARSPEGSWGSSARVDFEGNFLLEDVGAGRWSVQGRTGESGRFATAEVTLSQGSLSANVDLDFGAGFTLSGRVLRGGAPVDGVSVFAAREGVVESARASSNSEGRYTISGLSAGEYRVTAMEGFTEGAVDRSILIEGDASLDLEFPSARITGRVLRAADREGLAGAVVSVERLEADVSRWASSTGATTNAEGSFAVEGLAAGAWRVKASLPGYAVAETSISLADGESLDDLALSLDATEGLLLRVLDPMGRPVNAARVAVLDPAGRSITSSHVEASENGTLFIESVPAGTWEVIVQAGGAALGRGSARAPGPANTLQLARACSLQVTVADLVEAPAPAELTLVDGSGSAHRTLSWGGQVNGSFSLSAGHASFDNLPPGSWTLTVVASDGRRWQGQAQTTPELPVKVTM